MDKTGKFYQKRKERYSLQPSASLTLESAFVFPFFFLTIVILISFLDLFRIQALLTSSLSQSARELGMYKKKKKKEDTTPVGIVNDAVCVAYAQNRLSHDLKSENLSGLSLFGSSYRNGIISLKATCLLKIPVSLFSVKPVKLTASASAQAWLGYNGNKYGDTDLDSQEEMVYVTESQSVYHTEADCTHLKLSVSKTGKKNLSQKRNIYGEKYRPCEKCIHGQESSSFYITQTGTHYHSTPNCSGLTRHVKLIKKSEIGELHICSRCKNRNGGNQK